MGERGRPVPPVPRALHTSKTGQGFGLSNHTDFTEHTVIFTWPTKPGS